MSLCVPRQVKVCCQGLHSFSCWEVELFSRRVSASTRRKKGSSRGEEGFEKKREIKSVEFLSLSSFFSLIVSTSCESHFHYFRWTLFISWVSKSFSYLFIRETFFSASFLLKRVYFKSMRHSNFSNKSVTKNYVRGTAVLSNLWWITSHTFDVNNICNLFCLTAYTSFRVRDNWKKE